MSKIEGLIKKYLEESKTEWYSVEEDNAFKQGHTACRRGDQTLEDNPYSVEEQENLHNAWRDGFYQYKYE